MKTGDASAAERERWRRLQIAAVYGGERRIGGERMRKSQVGCSGRRVIFSLFSHSCLCEEKLEKGFYLEKYNCLFKFLFFSNVFYYQTN